MIPVIDELKIEDLPSESITKLKIKMTANALGNDYTIPLIVAKGSKKGPILGITAMIHGDEVNGLSTVNKLFKEINVKKLTGTLIGVPIVNIPGYIQNKRTFVDGVDLNKIMPGKKDGTESQNYAFNFINKIIKKFEYHIDLHTASEGRINSVYVRADLQNKMIKKMAKLQNAQMIVHTIGKKGMLRKTCDELNIPSITVEIGHPLVIQPELVKIAVIGLKNVMSELNMIKIPIKKIIPIICGSSYWIYSKKGGILNVIPKLAEKVKKGEIIATSHDIFGELIHEQKCPEDGIVIGKSTNPICHTGSRILHLGIIKDN